MTSRRLVSRSRHNEDSSPVQQSHQRDSQASRPRQQRVAAPARRPPPLPPYEPPSCPLTDTAKRQIDQLRLNHDYSKYESQLRASMQALIGTSIDANERLKERLDFVKKREDKRIQNGNEKNDRDIQMGDQTIDFEARVGDLTEKADKALREMIDYHNELSMKDNIMNEVNEQIPAPPALKKIRMSRARDSENVGNEDDSEIENETLLEGEEEVPDMSEPGVSALNLLNDAKHQLETNYSSRSMRDRYENTDYGTFKRHIHDARHGKDGPPPPHARTWFQEDEGRMSRPSRRPDKTTGNTSNDDASDDEVVIARASANLRCPLTLKYFKEPYSNHVCRHTFEKSAIIDYHQLNAVSYIDPSQRSRGRQRPTGPRKITCPETGCNAMLELKDFYEDQLILRQVKRAQRDEAREDDGESDDDSAPSGTQKNRPERIDSDGMDLDEEFASEEQIQVAETVKRERAQHSRVAPVAMIDDESD